MILLNFMAINLNIGHYSLTAEFENSTDDYSPK